MAVPTAPDRAKVKLEKRISATAGFWSVALTSGAGRLYAGSTDGALRVYDSRTLAEQPVATLAGHRSYVTALAAVPGKDLVLSAGYDRRILAWQAGAEQPLRTIDAGARVNALAVSPDGAHVAAALDNLTVGVWEVATGKAVRTLQGRHTPATAQGRSSTAYAVAYSPDRRFLASGARAGDICIWDARTGEFLQRFETAGLYSKGNTSEYEWGGVRSLVFSPDGKQLFAGGMGPADQNSAGIDGLMEIDVFELESQKRTHSFQLEKSKGLLSSLALHPAQGWLVGAGGGGGAGNGGSGTLCLWNYEGRGSDGKPLAPHLFPTAMVARSLALSEDGQTAYLVGMEKGVTAGRLEAWKLG